MEYRVSPRSAFILAKHPRKHFMNIVRGRHFTTGVHSMAQQHGTTTYPNNFTTIVALESLEETVAIQTDLKDVTE